MSNFTLQIPWADALETLLFDDKVLLKRGDKIQTFERWSGYAQPTIYEVEVLEHTVECGVHTLRLSYKKTRNKGQALENEAWGNSTIVANIKTSKVKATWTNDPPDRELDGTVQGVLVRDELFEDLGYAYVRMRVRRQAAFRKALLDMGARCALSGETTEASLEASHLVDVERAGGFSPKNGIILRADIHKLFDSGHIVIKEDGSVEAGKNAALSRRYIDELPKWRLSDEELRRISTALKKRKPRKIVV